MSSLPFEPNDTTLAMLVACQRRGPLTLDELTMLAPRATLAQLEELTRCQWLEARGERYAISRAGNSWLNGVVEAIEGQLTPEAPAYERRFRRETPTLPFAANTTWAEAVCVNFRMDPAALRPLVPAQFALDLYAGHGWISLTASRLKNFGMGALPAAWRMNFYQATYRAHVTFTDFRGRRLRGCYFVRSETNSPLMSLTANLLPEFKAHHCATYPMLMARRGEHFVLTVDSAPDPAGRVVLVLDTARPLAAMPPGSVFPTRAAAYEFIVNFHDAFSHDPETGEVFILRIERGEWEIQVLPPVDSYFGFLSAGPLPAGAGTVDSVFYFQNCPYRWLPLVRERLPRRPGE